MRFEAKAFGRASIRPEQVVKLEGARIQGKDFAGRKLVQFTAAGCRFEDCSLDRVQIASASFGSGKTMSEYVRCSFDGARIHLGPGGLARFSDCTFRDADLSEWFCFAVELVRCEFSGRIRTAVFNGTVPERLRVQTGRERNEFLDNDFSGAELIDVAFRTGIDLSKQRLPAGDEYLYLPDAGAAVNRAYEDVTAWKDEQLRNQAMGLIRTLKRVVQGGQRQLLLREANFIGFSSMPNRAVGSVFASLRDHSANHIDDT